MDQRPIGLSDTLLLEIISTQGAIQRDIGAINAQLGAGALRHAEFQTALDRLDVRTDAIDNTIKTVVEPMAKRLVEEIEPVQKRHSQILGRIATVMGLASAAMTGAFYLIYYGIQNFGPTVMGYLRGKGVN